MLDFVDRMMSKNGSNLELVEEVGSSLLHGTANLMRLSSSEASVVAPKDGVKSDENKRKQVKTSVIPVGMQEI